MQNIVTSGHGSTSVPKSPIWYLKTKTKNLEDLGTEKTYDFNERRMMTSVAFILYIRIDFDSLDLEKLTLCTTLN